MAYKIEIIGESCVVTETISSKEVFDEPKGFVYYTLELLNQSTITLCNLHRQYKFGSGIISFPLSEAVDSTSTPFTESTFKQFARDNLGFKTALGGSSAWGSITGTLSNQTDLQTALDSKGGIVVNLVTSNVTLPLASTLNVKTLYRYINRSGSSYTISTSGSDLIEGESSQVIYDNETFDLSIDGSNFRL